jgi:AcrR family transcriptional regulator
LGDKQAMSIEPADSDDRRRSIGARRNPETEEAVLSAAEAILSEAGLAGFSIEAVARRARAGKPTIYRWWPDKTALLLAIYHRQRPAAVHMDSGSVEEDVSQFLLHLLSHWGKGSAGEVFRSIVADAQTNPKAAETLNQYAAERRVQTGQLFVRGIERGELSGDVDVELAAEMLSALAWQRLLTGRLGMDEPEARSIARQFIRGLAAPGR